MDKYDKAVQYLTEHPGEIEEAWNYPEEHVAGCLFRYTGVSSEGTDCYGCLTQVKSGDLGWPAPTEALTQAIRNDPRIPTQVLSITVESLSVFAEWNRRLDAELGEERWGI